MARKAIVRTESKGAPLWMAQFVVLMLILIVFFMILVTLQKKREGGMKSGSGEVMNASGNAGGQGVFQFGKYGKGTFVPNPSFFSPLPQNSGTHRDLTEGGGGPGDTDAGIRAKNADRYIRLKLNSQFRTGSAAISAEMGRELRRIGEGVALLDRKVTVKCYSRDYAKEERDLALSFERLNAIAEFLAARTSLDSGSLETVAYPSRKYLAAAGSSASQQEKESVYFYIFFPEFKK